MRVTAQPASTGDRHRQRDTGRRQHDGRDEQRDHEPPARHRSVHPRTVGHVARGAGVGTSDDVSTSTAPSPSTADPAPDDPVLPDA